MKRIYWLFAAIVFLCVLPVVTAAVNDDMKVYVNGKLIETTILPQIHDGVTYLPAVILTDDLQMKATAASDRRTITFFYSGKEVEITADQSFAVIDGSKADITAKPFMSHGELFIPIHTVGSELGMKVHWDALTSSVFIFHRGASILEVSQPKPEQQDEQPLETPPSEEYEGHAILSEIRSEKDHIMIQLDRSMNARVSEMSNPNRIIIDLPDVQFGQTLNGEQTNHLGSIASNTLGIGQIRYSKFSSDPQIIRIVLDTTSKLNYDVTYDENEHRIIFSVDETVIANQPKFKIVIDAGHGGKDPGAESASKHDEKYFTLDLAEKVESLLKKEPLLEPYMTRTDDTFLSLDDRAYIANKMQADLFISIHGNTYETPISGTETYYYNSISYDFAKVMHKHVLKGTQLPDRNVKKESFRVLKATTMPAVLLELGYLSNKEDEQVMLTEEFQNRVAESIVNGIKEYLGVD